jgi:predicted Zn-dependent protease with MMP-like domain
MTHEEFVNVAEETLDSLPEEFRSRIQNVAILVEDYPPKQSRSQPGQQRQFASRHLSRRACDEEERLQAPTGPEHIVLYQKNIDQSVQAKPKCVIKFARLSYMNWGTVLG